MGREVDAEDLNLAFKELLLAYELDPDNEQIHEILVQVGDFIHGSIIYEGEDYVFAYLTATPTPRFFITQTAEATPAAQAPANTAAPQEARPSPTIATTVEEDASTPDQPLLPICGLALVLLPIGLLLTKRSQRRMRFEEPQYRKQW